MKRYSQTFVRDLVRELRYLVDGGDLNRSILRDYLETLEPVAGGLDNVLYTLTQVDPNEYQFVIQPKKDTPGGKMRIDPLWVADLRIK